MKILIVLIMLLATTLGHADEFRINKSCYPQELQQRFLDKGYIVDIGGSYRTEESWGFIENKGNAYSVYTYHSATKQELKDILEIING